MTCPARLHFARPLSLLLGLFLLAATASAQGRAEVTVLDPTPGATLLKVQLDGYAVEQVPAAGAGMVQVSIPGEGHLDVPGNPLVPRLCRSVVIPPDLDVVARVVSARFHDVTDVNLVPGRGPIPRTQDPARVPYTIGSSYARDAFFPGALAAVRDPYIMRDVRGTVLEVNALQYNPVQKVLRVYDELLVRIEATGQATVNRLDLTGAPDRADASFLRIFQHHFVNWTSPEAVTFVESGDMLIISHGPFMAAMQPFMNWKNSLGIQTTIVDVATIGNNATAIKNYIQGVYAGGNLSYVLLVGDKAEVATGSFSGGESDPFYSTLTADWYPDLLVGRFSAQSVADVQTQVERSIEYEQADHSLAAGGWNTYGMGIASNQGPGHYGEYDDEHMDLIRQDLLSYGFAKVDRIYDYFGTKTMIKTGLEEGRRLIHYCGHGSTTSWGTTGWNNSDINNLVNDNLLPAIHSVACVNGNFSSTCFGETWLRATHNGEPTGAVGAYMSSINQYWNEPMYAQDETVDLFVAESWWGMGALWFAGSCKMMDITSSSGRDMFMTWICFGDPSLRLLGDNGCARPTTYCTTSPNSAGPGALIGYGGTTNVASNDFSLSVSLAPPGQNGIFFYGAGQNSVPFGEGTLCVSAGGAGVFRLMPTQTVAPDGTVSYLLDNTNPSVPAAQITAGSTWYFQFWYRDPAGGPAGYNLTDGLEATFCP